MQVKRLFHEEKGAVLPFVALLLALVLIGFAALAVDAGLLYTSKKEMVTAADAGALAGAKEMELALKAPGTYETAKAKAVKIAKDVALANGADEVPIVQVLKMTVNIGEGVTENRDVIRVVVKHNNQNYFAGIFGEGFRSTVVSSEAIATWGYTRKVMGGSLLPLFMLESDYIAGVDILHTEEFTYNGVISPPNIGYIKLGEDATGKKIISDALEGDKLEEVFMLNQVIISETGVAQGPAINSIEERMKTADGLATIDERKQYMTGLVPIVHYDGTLDTNAMLHLPVQYFAVFVIKDVITNNQQGGSEFALSNTNFKNEDGTAFIDYTTSRPGIPKGTIIGEFADTPVILWADVESGDQEIIVGFDVTETPTYSKLVK